MEQINLYSIKCLIYIQSSIKLIKAHHIFSAEDFSDLEAVFENTDVLYEKEKFVEKFKTDLFESVKKQLSSGWVKCGIDEKVRILEYCKENQRSDEVKFRPTGKTPEEQVKHLEIKMWLKKKQCFEQHLSYQKKQMEVIVN